MAGAGSEAAGIFGPVLGLLRKSPAAVGERTAEAARDMVRVYRWGDRTDPGALLPSLEKAGTEIGRANHAVQLERDSDYVAWRAKRHAQGFTEDSPFVSLAGDTDRAAAAPEPRLVGIARLSPDLAVLDVPRDRLIDPGLWSTRQETEVLWMGNDLADHLVEWVPNPYRGPLS